MRIRRRWITGACLAMFHCVAAWAQDVSEADKPRVLAALNIASFDALAERCAGDGGFDPEQRAEVDRWLKTNEIDRLRKHLDGPVLSPILRQQVQGAAAQVVRMVPAKFGFCAAAVALTRTRDAQLADKLPLLLAGAEPARPAVSGTSATPVAPAGSRPAAARAANPPVSGRAAQYAPSIEGFGFDNCVRVGYGGMILLVPCPVVLFRDGRVLTDVEGLNDPQGLGAHRGAHPDDWTQWRREGGRIQLKKEKGWEDLAYTTLYSTLPKDFTLDGRYHSSGGTGNTAMGGGQGVVVWSDYVFTPDGRVSRDGGAGASSTGTGTDVTAYGSNSRRGRYRVDGLVLSIDYEDGSKERRILIADPKDRGRGTMWLDGEGYIYKK